MKTVYRLTTALIACGFALMSAATEPVSSPNPWDDDYTSVSAFDNYESWGTYNVHDPSCILAHDGYYYMYSTDAIYFNRRHRSNKRGIKPGFIQVRRSHNLVDWEYAGWAFDSIPAEAVEWVKSQNNGRGAGNIWAPYITKVGDTYRLYYCVSAFGKKTSYIGLAESTSPMGPWQQRGCVVKTTSQSPMNAIDPTVIQAPDGRHWMHYGSYFGGIYCIELNPATGLPLKEGDQGVVSARRANWRVDNLEAPEVYYNAATGHYYLFGSYEPLMTTYNVRVCRSDRPEGPFIDFFGKEMRDTTDNFPILTAPYRFDNHRGWAGTGHCGVFDAGDGRVFMVHQGRLQPRNDMMDLHLRQVFFTADGWPVVSPERYAAVPDRKFQTADLTGVWEIIRIEDPKSDRKLEAGQVLWGEGRMKPGETNTSVIMSLYRDGYLTYAGSKTGSWSLDTDSQLLTLTLGSETINNIIVHAGHDWERQTDTILFTGLDSRGRSIWGKLVK